MYACHMHSSSYKNCSDVRTIRSLTSMQIFVLAGQFDEKVFQALDWVLAEAAKRRLKVMLTLVNYWSAYGGMQQYVK